MGRLRLRQGRVGLIVSRVLPGTPACTHVAPSASPGVWYTVFSLSLFFFPHVLSHTEAPGLHITAQQVSQSWL